MIPDFCLIPNDNSAQYIENGYVTLSSMDINEIYVGMEVYSAMTNNKGHITKISKNYYFCREPNDVGIFIEWFYGTDHSGNKRVSIQLHSDLNKIFVAMPCEASVEAVRLSNE